MGEVFGPIYADVYDALYQDKDYEAECDLINRLLDSHADIPPKSILDLGCGTGNHALRLARRGFEVVGVDRSEPMIRHAREKTSHLASEVNADFHVSDIADLDLDREFDAVVMMFGVLGYQVDNGAVLDAFRTARKHLRLGGLVLFDCWFGPAVLNLRPGERIKVIPDEEGEILRAASGHLDLRRHVCNVHYRIWRMREGHLVSRAHESHQLRFFFPMELEFLLGNTGFTLVKLGAFPDVDQELDETTWNAACLARAT